MAKLMYVVPPAMGHYSPTRNGALKLVERGHDVLYVTSAPFKQVLASDGLAFRCYEDDPVISEFGSVEGATRWACEAMASRGIFALARVAKKLFVDSAREKAKELGPFVDRYRPDVVVADLFSLEVPLVCESRGIPWATHCWSLVPVNRRELPVLSTGLPSPTTVGARAMNLGARALSAAVFRGVDRYYNELRRTCRLAPVSGCLFLLSPWLVLGPCAEPFAFPLRHMPGQVHYVGPTNQGGNAFSGQPFPFDALSESLPKVYVSLGTVFCSREGFFETVVEALREEPVQLILALGNSAFGASEAARLPGHWIAQEFVPQGAILGSVDAMITHGGSNTVTDGLSSGVPMIVCPMNADNFDLAQRVAELKIGLRLPERALTNPLALRAAVRRVLSDGGYRRRSRGVSEVYRKLDGSTRSAELLELLAERLHPIHRDSSLFPLEEGSCS